MSGFILRWKSCLRWMNPDKSFGLISLVKSVKPSCAEKFILIFSPLPCLVLMITTPAADLEPYTAAELASFNTSIVSISDGLMSLIEPLKMTPSNTIKGELLAESEAGPRISISLAPEAEVPMLELKPATVPFSISNTFVLC